MPSMSFKELLEQDVKNVFLNPEEFGEVHTVNGKEMAIVIDNYELQERQGQTGHPKDGSYMKQKLVYVAASDFGPLPKQGVRFRINKEEYRVIDAAREGSLYQIIIEAHQTR